MNFLKRFGFAFQGLKYLLLKEKNFQLHLFFLLCVILFGFLFKISEIEWIAVLICSSLVLSLEVVNTVIEKLADFVEEKQNAIIKIIKDVSAAAVLIASFFSLIVASIIFIPKILKFLT